MNDGNFNTFESIGTHALTTRRGRFVYVALNYATASMGRGVLSPRVPAECLSQRNPLPCLHSGDVQEHL